MQDNKRALEAILGIHNSWPLCDVLSKLVESTEYLLHVKDYDKIGWEDVSHCVTRGKEILEVLNEVNQVDLSNKLNPEWVRVDSKLPIEGQQVLAIGDGNKISMCEFRNGLFERYVDMTDHDRCIVIYYNKITHWMEMPPIPTK